ncbi:hypothetical protein ACQ4PT_028570 [Festuca glaucescens]
MAAAAAVRSKRRLLPYSTVSSTPPPPPRPTVSSATRRRCPAPPTTPPSSACPPRASPRSPPASASSPRPTRPPPAWPPSASGSTPAAASSCQAPTAPRTSSSTWPSRAPSAAPLRTRWRWRSRTWGRASTPTPPASRPPSSPTCRAATCPPRSTSSATSSSTRASRSRPSSVSGASSSARWRRQVQGMMEEVIFDHLHTAAFRDHPLGDTILGPKENIQSISKNDLQQYISTHYTCPRTVVSAAGDVDHDEVVDKVKELFTGFSTDPTTADQLVEANPAVFTGSEVRIEDAEMPLAHLAIAFKGSSWTDPRSIPLMVTQSILGSWNRSIGVGNCSGSSLARGISNGGLAESLMAFNTNYRDTGLFGIYTTAPPDALHDLSRLIMEEFRRLAFRVSETEVARARNQLKSSLLLHIDGSTAVSENNGRQMLTYGRVMPFLELFARIDAVDCAAIMETAKDFIVDKDVALAAVGPVSNLPELSWFRSQTSSDDKFTAKLFSLGA